MLGLLLTAALIKLKKPKASSLSLLPTRGMLMDEVQTRKSYLHACL